MAWMWEILVLLLLIAIVAMLVAPRFIRPGARGATEEGTLLITGVSPRPDATGEQYVTITGVIHGPTVSEHETYQRVAVDVADWPTIGALIPVRYSSRNPDNWRRTAPDADGD